MLLQSSIGKLRLPAVAHSRRRADGVSLACYTRSLHRGWRQWQRQRRQNLEFCDASWEAQQSDKWRDLTGDLMREPSAAACRTREEGGVVGCIMLWHTMSSVNHSLPFTDSLHV